MAKESNESCRFGKSVVCPKCKAVNNFDFSTDLLLDYLAVNAACPSCGREFKTTLESVKNNKSMRRGKKAKPLEMRESSRMGKSFVCSSCGLSIDFDMMTDSALRGLDIAGCCPVCFSDVLMSLDSFLNNRAVLVFGEESEGAKTPERKKRAGVQPRKHRQKEKLDYIR